MVFLIHRLRNAAVVRLLVGPTLHGILCSDRWRGLRGRAAVAAADLLGPFEAQLGETAGTQRRGPTDCRRTLLIILAALIVAIACWAPIGLRMFSAPPSVGPATSESSGTNGRDK